jgi:catechol 2,3-dioxygenase-like lactoylglutathione lyase family enzyme
MRKQSAFMNVVVRRFAGAARRLDPRPSESLLSSPSIRGNAVAAPPAFQKSAPGAWPQEDCANEPTGFFACVERNALWALGARVALVLLLFVVSPASQAAVREVSAVGLTVGDLDREVEFFTKVLLFEKLSESKLAPGAADELLGLTGTQLRTAELRLGDEHIILIEHVTNKGRRIPADSRSFDHWFQHIAIVVSDMDAAYEHLRGAKVKHVSTAPQTLPAWNKDAGGIKAFYFRDPEDHVLEIIWFPPGKGDLKWQPLGQAAGSETGTPLFLGIDHTAIVVGDTDRSLVFYTNVLRLHVVGGAENYGAEQEHLSQVFGARLRITALRAERGPGIEFLEYITPPGGRPLPPNAQANDLVFWRTHLVVDDYAFLSDGKGGMFARPVSRPGASGSFIVRDPDGHALQLEDRRAGRLSDSLETGDRQAHRPRVAGEFPADARAE